MTHCLSFLLLLLTSATLAQTTEPIQYAITQPANSSVTLEGTLSLPANAKGRVPVVLLIAGSGPTDRDCNSGYGLKTDAFNMLADSLNRLGIAVARYDKRYSGTNLMKAARQLPEQDFRFDYFVSDAIGFIRQLQADKRFSKVVVAGHSEGSLVGMLAARQTNVSGFISIAGAGQNIADVLKTQMQTLPDTLRRVAYRSLDSLRAGQLVKSPNPLLLSLLRPSLQPGMISWMKYDPAQEIKQFKGSVLIINGKRDFQVAVSEAERLKAARPDAQLLLFDRMTHVLKDAATDSMTDKQKTYSDPTLPLTPGLATAIAQFVMP
ncbi:alpha/beta hydrolase family protein [Spirosoma montaniterrae]|uniref:Alpha/beta hydrolase n=1 Tax=Spirosoma montaniterrae TaxID=1178516 RepID=A0A1P9WVD2_9BACT|nr:alpha/beta fold hydrolase [Spirosoma montaniterrae]AQG79334.1 alpha/beta hydrolase [Spirosoma montaniterrae]